MVELFLVRHGIAVPHGTPDIPDDERPLTPKGIKRMKQIARGLRRLKVDPERIVTSPLPRALETAQIVAEELDKEDVLEQADELRADRPAAAIKDWVLGRPERSLMIVGHDPAFSELAGLLAAGHSVGAALPLEKGGVAALKSVVTGGMVVEWLAPPRLLRRFD